MTHEMLTPSFLATSRARTNWRMGRPSFARIGITLVWSLPWGTFIIASDRLVGTPSIYGKVRLLSNEHHSECDMIRVWTGQGPRRNLRRCVWSCAMYWAHR